MGAGHDHGAGANSKMLAIALAIASSVSSTAAERSFGSWMPMLGTFIPSMGILIPYGLSCLRPATGALRLFTTTSVSVDRQAIDARPWRTRTTRVSYKTEDSGEHDR